MDETEGRRSPSGVEPEAARGVVEPGREAALETLDARQRDVGRRSRPADALDAQTALVTTLGTPAAVTFAGRAFGGIAENQSWRDLTFATPTEVSALRGDLSEAATYWVAPDLVDVVELASRSMPDQPLLATDLPVGCGFVWVPFSVWPGGVRAAGPGLRAFSWHGPGSLAPTGQVRVVL